MKTTKLLILVILTLSLVACSKPAPEPPALPNQPPPPKATAVPTPTPVYYILDLVVKDPAGQAIPGASAVAGDQSSQAGATGIVSFVDLSAGPLPLTVYAEGYRPKQLSQTLQPGDNQIEVVLEPDPFVLRLDLPTFCHTTPENSALAETIGAKISPGSQKA